MAPVAAEIIPGRPPAKAITTAMLKEAYRPIFGSTPAMMEKAMASGISARATTRPASRSPRRLENQFCFSVCSIGIPRGEARPVQSVDSAGRGMALEKTRDDDRRSGERTLATVVRTVAGRGRHGYGGVGSQVIGE